MQFRVMGNEARQRSFLPTYAQSEVLTYDTQIEYENVAVGVGTGGKFGAGACVWQGPCLQNEVLTCYKHVEHGNVRRGRCWGLAGSTLTMCPASCFPKP
eukprot:366539-Chlamydomonas_euryale.AAC.5